MEAEADAEGYDLWFHGTKAPPPRGGGPPRRILRAGWGFRITRTQPHGDGDLERNTMYDDAKRCSARGMTASLAALQGCVMGLLEALDNPHWRPLRIHGASHRAIQFVTSPHMSSLKCCRCLTKDIRTYDAKNAASGSSVSNMQFKADKKRLQKKIDDKLITVEYVVGARRTLTLVKGDHG